MDTRNYGLDALRAIMMLLGIVVHAASAYTSLYVFPNPIKDSSTNIFYDLLIFFIHSFRMPVFFVLSGFFMALLYDKKGLKATAINRINRIVFPFFAAMILIAPLVKMLVLHYSKNMSWEEIMTKVKDLSIYTNLRAGHLWFLYYLILIYLICHCVKVIKPAFLVRVYTRSRNYFFMDSPKSSKIICIFSFISFCFILAQHQGLIDTSMDFVPDPRILFMYLVYFVFGYMLFSFRAQMDSLFNEWKIHLVLSLVVLIFYLFSFMNSIKDPGFVTIGLTSLLCAALSWLMVFGLFGLFLHTLNKESRLLTLISKSSYWIYLTHLPLTILFGGLFLDWPIPNVAKFLLNILLTYGILTVTYKLFVEKTFIGRFLNGKSK